LVSQSNLKTLGPKQALYTSGFNRNSKFALVSRQNVGLPLARGLIRRDRSNRLKTGLGWGLRL